MGYCVFGQQPTTETSFFVFSVGLVYICHLHRTGWIYCHKNKHRIFNSLFEVFNQIRFLYMCLTNKANIRQGYGATPLIQLVGYTPAMDWSNHCSSAKWLLSKLNGERREISRLRYPMFFLWIALFVMSGCKISECRKAEEAMYAKYRYSIANDSLSDMGSELSFDCKHRYTRKYIRKHLGKPLRIYIHDDHSMGTDLYEEWIYISRQQKYPNEKPWIGSLLVLSFYINKPGMIEQGHGCPEPNCHLYSTMSFSDDIYTNLILRFNSDSFDIKYPYIIKNGPWFR